MLKPVIIFFKYVTEKQIPWNCTAVNQSVYFCPHIWGNKIVQPFHEVEQ